MSNIKKPNSAQLYHGLAARLLGLALVLSAPLSDAQQFSLRTWDEDTKVLESEVLQPLTERFASQACEPGMGTYISAYSSALVELRGAVASQSYLLFREAALITAEEFHPYRQRVSCKLIDRWQYFVNAIRKKINLLGNALTIMDLSG